MLCPSEQSSKYISEQNTAIAAVVAAAKLCEMVQKEVFVQGIEKQDRSPVTIADFASQALICRTIASTFPNDAIVAEEDAASLRRPEMTRCLQQVTRFVKRVTPDVDAESVLDWIDRGSSETVKARYWTLDPIDGTKGFLRGDQYAIALALIENGEVKLGILACPSLPLELDHPEGDRGVLFYAIRNKGAYRRGINQTDVHSIHVANPNDQQKLRFVEGVETAHSDHSKQEALAQSVGIQAPSIRMDSQAKYGMIAQGQAALYLRLPNPASPNYREKIWDHAAGSILVEEAGGRVTDMRGRPLQFSTGRSLQENQGIIASNGMLHDAILKALNA
ncbi:3'(2'),5'-bisphosphate nucleotidase [Thermoleptolyngbya oregonensis NK1-22]|uniref:3'(2'),5'-bisphosphate nucleotidase n=1 Tax=Thermoleptolyngbya oregonensis NK1-22 TaxID=2547457 RepID=A0AA96Y4R9_9CYAN|nr:3'(2'),5'-bisphosphate nucleotidase [Thermoleptolyngbya oregonensis]WOB43920.1 3'(2'),5'-bisphosphate nucleotidase [Thermoleptolyngbya oregonensis NK1-22]